MTLDLGRYPEYRYPFSYEGVLEKKLDDWAESGMPCDVSEVLRMIKPGADIADTGIETDPTYFREYYPRLGGDDFFRTHWAGEIAQRHNGYPSDLAPGVRLGDAITLRYGEPLLRGGPPTWSQPREYHCPYGWRRFSFKVPNFDAVKTYAVAYHGTSVESVSDILRTALRPGDCQEGGDGFCTYLSPSIEYAGCPRYAKIATINDRFVQAVLQFRVAEPNFTQGETLGPTFHRKCPGGWAAAWGDQTGGGGRPYPKEHIVFDPHFKNEELEWLYSSHGCLDLQERLVPTGLMLRILTVSPVELLRRRQLAAVGGGAQRRRL